jgi:ketosteroid isomerase-like protein
MPFLTRISVALVTVLALGVSTVPASSATASSATGGDQTTVAHQFYKALQAKDIDAFAKLWTRDAVYRVPVTADGVPGQMTGRDEIVSALREFFQLFGETRFTWQVEPLRDRDRLMATWTLDIQLVSGVRYQNRGVAIFQLERGRIADFSEYFDTAAFLAVFGNGHVSGNGHVAGNGHVVGDGRG